MRLRIAYIAVLGCALWQHGCGIEQNRSNGTARAPAGQVASTSVGDDFMGDRVYFLSLSVLSFSVDQYTASRRGSPHAQLTCTGGSAAGAFRVKLVDCYNIGLEHATAGGFSSGVVPSANSPSADYVRRLLLRRGRIRAEELVLSRV
jgi:hypothetical protein